MNKDMKDQKDENTGRLLADIGAVFHDHANTLLSMFQALNPILESLAPNPFERGGEPSPEKVDRVLAIPVANLVNSLRELVALIEHDWRERKVSSQAWEDIRKRFAQFQSYTTSIKHPTHRPPFLRQSARLLMARLKDLNSANVPSDKLAEIIKHAKEIERLVLLYELSMAKSRIVAMDHQARTLRDYLTEQARPNEPRGILRIRTLIRHVMQGLEEFANQKGVELRETKGSEDALIYVVERDVERTLSNLLHNAIKYSWKLQGSERAWVNIKCYVNGERVIVEFENWGVPIEKDEITEGLIFRFGYRGALASDRSRSGTGIGLYDALKTAQKYGGDIHVISVPAKRYERPGYGKQPYITTVKLSLPLHRSSEMTT